MAAIDVQVEAATAFTINQIVIDLAGDFFDFDYSLQVYDGQENPENLIDTRTLQISNFGATDPSYVILTLNLDEELILEAGLSSKKYWLAVSAVATTDNPSVVLWKASAYEDSTEDAPLFYSTDGGSTWSDSVPGASVAVEGSINVKGVCEDIEVEEEPEPEPEPCNQSYGWAGNYNIAIDNDDAENITKMAAIDVQVDAATSFTIDQIVIDLAGDFFDFDYSLQVYDGQENPEYLIDTRALQIANFGATDPSYVILTLNLDEELILEAGLSSRKYWLAVSAVATTDNQSVVLWKGSAYEESTDDAPLFYSTDGGSTWSDSVPGASVAVEGSINVKGMCQEIEVDEEPCTDPINLTIGEVDDTTAEVSWTPTGGETQWQVAYGEEGYEDPSSQEVLLVEGNPETTLTNLDSDTSYDVYVRAICGAETSDWVGPVQFNTTLSLKNHNLHNFSFYPNPAENQLNINAGQAVDELVFYNILGQKVMKLNPGSTNSEIDVSKFDPGLYMMKVTIGTQSKTYKLIKN